MSDAELVDETIRLYRRYAVEVVERFSFCPYAERARVDGRSREVVLLAPELAITPMLAEVERLARDPGVEVAFFLLPRVRIDRLGLGRFVETLRSAHQASPGGLVLTMEGFHPDGPLDVASAGRVVPFLRRTPDPTIQLTRLTSLEHVRRSVPAGTGYLDPARVDLHALLSQPIEVPVSERIAATNLATAKARSAEIEAVIADIHADRDRVRARLS